MATGLEYTLENKSSEGVNSASKSTWEVPMRIHMLENNSLKDLVPVLKKFTLLQEKESKLIIKQREVFHRMEEEVIKSHSLHFPNPEGGECPSVPACRHLGA